MDKLDPFKPRPDKGNLHATTSKRKELSPDYFGEIALNLSDMTNIRVEDGLHIVKLSGWKTVSKTSGKTYLSLSVKRKEFEEQGTATPPPPPPAPKEEISDDDIPF